MPAMQRRFTEQLIKWVAEHRLFRSLKKDIDAGKILPCLRDGEIHLYERGARILRFTARRVYTHPEYACACLPDVSGDREVALPDDLDPHQFTLIRKAAGKHRAKRPNDELVAVHDLFPEFAVTRCAHQDEELALIDVEIRFGKHETDTTLRANMIDLAFLLPNRSLLFIEVKCIGNAAIIGRSRATVEDQVAIYERHIQRGCVLEAVNRSLCAQSKLVGKKLGNADKIVSRVPVLILNPAKNQITRHNDWLRQALDNAQNGRPSCNGVSIIDGTSDPIEAIQCFAAGLLGKPSK